MTRGGRRREEPVSDYSPTESGPAGDRTAAVSRSRLRSCASAVKDLRSGLLVAASGIFTGSAAETQVKGLALAGALEAYELSFESGERMQGTFLVTRLEYAGDFNGERNYTLALESSGEVVAL